MKWIYLVCLLFVAWLPGQTRLTILHTNNINGTLENCLCADHPLGSIEKIKYVADSVRRSESNVLFVDGGDFFTAFGDPEKDTVLLKALKLLDYDVLSPGDQLFANGPEFFRNYLLHAGLPWISANLKVEGSLVGRSHKLVQVGPVRVLIMAVIDSATFRFYPKKTLQILEIKNPEQTLQNILQTVNADYRIVLSHRGLEADKQMARRFPKVNLIIGAHSQDMLESPVKIGNTQIVQAGSDGYYLGRLDVVFDEDKHPVKFNGRLLPMHISLPNDSSITDLAADWDYQFILRSQKQNRRPTVPPKPYLIATAGACKSCHKKEWQAWHRSPHAASWQTLNEKHKTKSAACLSCHVSGLGRRDGFINENLTPGLAAVTCTSCHLMNRAAGHKKTKIITQKQCLNCHNETRDADFDFAGALKRLEH